MLWLFVLLCILLILYRNGLKGTVLTILMLLLTLAILFVSFIFGALLLFVYDDAVVRAWTIPNLWVNDVASSDSMGIILLALPLVAVADFLRVLAHLLLRHAHVLTWATVIIGMYFVFGIWISALRAWFQFRKSRSRFEE